MEIPAFLAISVELVPWIPLSANSLKAAFIIWFLVSIPLSAVRRPPCSIRTWPIFNDYPITWAEYLQTLGSWIGKKTWGRVPFRVAWTLGTVLKHCSPRLA